MENNRTKMLNKITHIVCWSLSVADGLKGGNVQLQDAQYALAASGAFGLMSSALSEALELLSNLEDCSTMQKGGE